MEGLEHKLSSIRDQLRKVLDDGINGQHSVSSDVGMSVLKVGSDSFNERLEQLLVVQLAEETKCTSSHVLIGIVQVTQQSVTAIVRMSQTVVQTKLRAE